MSSPRARSILGMFFVALGACGAEAPASQRPAVAAPLETSSTASPSASVATAPPFEEIVRRFVKDSTTAWASRDPKRHSALFAENAVVRSGTATGWDEGTVGDRETSIAGISAAFPDLEVSYTRVVARAPYAVVEWTFTGTNKGPYMGHRATGKKVGYRAASWLTFTPDGKVLRESNYIDMDTVWGQLGLGPGEHPVRAVEPRPSASPVFLFAGIGDKDTLGRSWISLFDKADAEKLGSVVSEDVVVSDQYAPSDIKGRKALLEDLVESGKAFVRTKTTILMCIPTATVIACEYEWRANWKGPETGTKSTDQALAVHSLELVEVRDGKVVRVTSYANVAELVRPLGLDAPALRKK